MANLVCSEVRTAGSIIGSSGSTTVAVAEPQAAVADVMLPAATNSTLQITASTIGGVASRSESEELSSSDEEFTDNCSTRKRTKTLKSF